RSTQGYSSAASDVVKRQLTTRPGVYVMRDEKGEIIYIGKAKNLKNRVSQYFRSSPKPSKVQAMVDHVDDFDYFIAVSELDALALESNLIKKHQPFYNILLKDGKAFPYIKIDMKEDFPRLEIVRRVKKNDGAKYFGPYISGITPKEILKTISFAFKLRTCKTKINPEKPAKRECLNYSLGLCHAPCTGRITKEEYGEELKKVIRFLSGNDDEIEKILQEKMEIASDLQNFERAIELRECLKMVAKLKERVVANLPKDVNKDVFAYTTDGLSGVITQMVVRGGKILGIMNYAQNDAELEESETLFNFISQYYSNSLIPNEIIVSHSIDEQLLSEFLDKNVKTIDNPHGVNLTLLKMAKENAEEYLNKHLEKEKRTYNSSIGALKVLQEKLQLKNFPRRMECYDISHISGTNKVASMVVFIDGVPAKKHYRKFKIKTVQGNNDFESLKEAITRRLKRYTEQNGESFKEKPDLLVIDGGKGQLTSTYEILKSFVLENKIEMISLAKRIEEVFRPYNNIPVILKYGSAELKLLQRIRDEAHRFAITFHRELRTKSQTQSELENIPGLGKIKINALLKAFGTTENIKNASIEELCLVKGIHEALAIEIKKYFENQQ
ncbi:MAG: excinuclease ABC subunit UvrC, partial [Clostridia bacterium]|nr:excinuclease ABC subunit UvrC [Clostridia bacterium]